MKGYRIFAVTGYSLIYQKDNVTKETSAKNDK